jgi:hypothetical protein
VGSQRLTAELRHGLLPVYITKHNVSETGFCLRLQVKPTKEKENVLVKEKKMVIIR